MHVKMSLGGHQRENVNVWSYKKQNQCYAIYIQIDLAANLHYLRLTCALSNILLQQWKTFIYLN